MCHLILIAESPAATIDMPTIVDGANPARTDAPATPTMVAVTVVACEMSKDSPAEPVVVALESTMLNDIINN